MSPRAPRADGYRGVYFDCDSTLTAVEGIETLAGPNDPEVIRLTELAMRGAVPLDEVYGRRLAIVRPTRAQVERLGERYVDALVADARDAVRALRESGIAVRIISGGLLPAVRHVAHALGVGPADVDAVDIYFDERGAYAGFDASSPLARGGGKRVAIDRWRPSVDPAMLVGDGATDLEAADAVALFVGFAGVVARAPVVAGADVVIRAPTLAPIVPLALGAREPASAFHALVARGRALLTLDSTRAASAARSEDR